MKIDPKKLEDRLARAEALAQLLDDRMMESEEVEACDVYLASIIREDLTACMDMLRSPVTQEKPL